MIRKIFLLLVILAFAFAGMAWAQNKPLTLEDLMKQIETKGAKWKAGKTSVSDLSLEQKQRRMGLKSPKIAPPKEKLLVLKPLLSLPTSVDYRIQGWVSSVKDQGNCGSCWAFAATANDESVTMMAQNQPNSDLNLSEQVIVSCDTQDSGCNGGQPDLAADFVQNQGLPLASCDPYTSGTTGDSGDCSSACANWQQNDYKIQSWSWVTSATVTDLNAIKQALLTYGPLTTTMNVYDDFMSYTSGVYTHVSGQLDGGHAIQLIGYDDSQQAWLAKNSWGTDWGESGFFWIAYSESTGDSQFGAYSIAYVAGGTPPSSPPPPTSRMLKVLESLDGGQTWITIYQGNIQ